MWQKHLEVQFVDEQVLLQRERHTHTHSCVTQL